MCTLRTRQERKLSSLCLLPRAFQLLAAADAEQDGAEKLALKAIIHTSVGDVHIKLYPKETPKTNENFATHARNGYYNGIIFHRVIQGFMLQVRDRPEGTTSCIDTPPCISNNRETEMLDNFRRATLSATALAGNPSGANSLRMSSTGA